MGSGRVTIKNFSSRSRKVPSGIFAEDDPDDLFVARDRVAKRSASMQFDEKEKTQKDLPDIPIADSGLSGDVFDGLTLGESLGEERQGREDVHEVIVKKNRKNRKTHRDEKGSDDNYDPYADVREDLLTDEDSTSQFSGSSTDISTLMSNDASIVHCRDRGPYNNQCTDADGNLFACPDDTGMGNLFALTMHYGGKGAQNIDEMNRFLYKELEIGTLAMEAEDLRQEVVKNGWQTLQQVEWKELFKSFYDTGCIGSKAPEPPTLTSFAAEDRQALPEPPDVALNTCAANVSDFTLEEGMEMPYPSCGAAASNEDVPPGDDEPAMPMKKRNSLLTKLFPNPKGAPTIKTVVSEPVPTPDTPPAVPAKRPSVTRVKLKDGSMASVNVDTVDKLQKCHWV